MARLDSEHGIDFTPSLEAAGAKSIVVENPYLLFNAEYSRQGSDLILSDDRGSELRLQNYFDNAEPADLVSPDGARLTGDVVEALAGPAFPGQVAQGAPGAAVAAGAKAIGQVETLTGTATVQRSDGTTETLSLGTQVFPNDVVATADGGSLSITFEDGTIFTLAAGSRMVLNELVYDPASDSNSGVFNLVEGSFVFIAGQVAKTGGMEVITPVATMGIRGTTVRVDIETVNGVSTVDISLVRDPDGGLGNFTITGLDGSPIASVTGTETKWIISPVDGQTREVPKLPGDLAKDNALFARATQAYEIAEGRVRDGGEYLPNNGPNNQDRPDDAPDDDRPDGNNPDAPDDDRRGELGSGLETDVAGLNERPGVPQIGSATETLGGDGPPLDPPAPGVGDEPNGPRPPLDIVIPDVPNDAPIDTGPVTATGPSFTFPNFNGSVTEDGFVILTGFSFTDTGGPLTVTLVAGSTVTINPNSGVTILEGTGTNDERLVINGTAEQIEAALNANSEGPGLTYRPSSDADGNGSLTITSSDGTSAVTGQLTLPIDPVQDAPTAGDDAITRSEDDGDLIGDLLLNDSDPDTSPQPDVLTVTEVTYAGFPFIMGEPLVLTNNAQITFLPNGLYVFEPGNNYQNLNDGESVVETFTYTLDDGNGNTDTATLTLTIEGADDAAPIVTVTPPDPFTEALVGEVDTVRTFDLADAATATLGGSPAGLTVTDGTVEIFVSVGGAAGTAVAPGLFTVSGSLVSFDSIVFDTLGDGEDASFIATFDAVVNGETLPQLVEFTVNGVNDAPVSSGSEEISVNLNGVVTVGTDTLNAFDVDDEDDSLTITVTNPAPNGFFALGSAPGTEITSFTLGDLRGGAIVFNNDGTVRVDTTITVSLADDGADGAEAQLSVINIISIDNGNLDPSGTGVQASLTATEDIQSTLDVSNIVIADADAAGGDVTVTFTSSNGTMVIINGPDVVVGGTGNVATLTGTVDALNAYFAGSSEITYRGPTDFNGAASIAVTVNDNGNSGSGGGTDVLIGTVAVTVSAVNDDPGGSGVPSAFFTSEDTLAPLDVSAIQITDVDATSGDVTVTFNASIGSIIIVADGDVTVGGSTSEATLTGTVVALNTYFSELANVSYLGLENFNGTATISVTVNDNGNDGAGGGGDISLGTIAVTLEPQDDAPEITITPPAALDEAFVGESVAERQFNLLDTVSVTDIDSPGVASINGTSVSFFESVSGVPGAPAAGGIFSMSGDNVLFDGASFDYLGDGETQNFIATFDLNVDGTLTPHQVEFTITGSNDGPTIGGSLGGSVANGGTIVLNAPHIDGLDVDDEDTSLTVSVDTPPVNGIIALASQPTVAITSFTVGQSRAGDVVYVHNGSSTTTDSFNFSIADDGADSVAPTSGTFNLNINVGANSDPSGSGLPTTLSANEDIQSTLDVSNIVISDADAGTGDATVTFTSSNGVIAIVGGAGVTVGGSDNVGTLTGTVTALNAYFAGSPEVTYTGPADFNGAASIDITVNDNGNTGSGGGTDIALGTVAVTVDAVNDDPTGSGLPLAQSTDEDVIAAVDFDGFSLGDIDAGAGELTVSFTPSLGGLSFVGDTGITITTAGTTVMVSGTLAALNAYFSSTPTVFYTLPFDLNGETTINVTVNDNGNTGTGGGTDIDLGPITFTVNPVNDAPEITGDLQGSLDEGETQFFGIGDLNGTDIDNADGDLIFTVTSSPANGTLLVDGSADTTFTVQQLRDSLVGYRHNGSETTSDTIGLSLSDGSLADTATLNITVNPVNDAPDAAGRTVSIGEAAFTVSDTVRQFASDPDNATSELFLTSVVIEGTSTSIPIGTNFTLASGAQIRFSANGNFTFTRNGAYEELGTGDRVDERFTYTFSDPGGLTDEGPLLLAILGSNDAPVITGDLLATVTEGDTVALTTADLDGTDIDDNDGSLIFTATTGPTNGTILVDGSAATSFTVQQLRDGQVSYTHNGSEGATDSIELLLEDGGEFPGAATPATATLNIDIAAINDDPTGTGLPVSVSVVEDAEGSVLITGFQIDDVDAGGGDFTVTFTADTGSIIVTGGTGVTAFSSGSVGTLTGTVAALNTYFSSASDLRYQSTQDFVGADNITVTINDGGNTGTGGGADVVVGAIAVDVVAFNDDPTATGLNLTQNVDEDVTTALDLVGLSLADVDSGSGELTVSFTPATGSISIVGDTGITVGSVGSTATVTGTLGALNAYFGASPDVFYTGPAEFSGTTSIDVTVNDNGNTGTGGGTDIALGTITVTIDPVNDAPVTELANLGADIALNGGFESGPADGVPGVQVEAGSTAITNWTVLSGNVDHIDTTAGAAEVVALEGENAIDLHGDRTGAIVTQLSTQTGATYVVEFGLSAAFGDGETIRDVEVGVNGLGEQFSVDTSGLTGAGVVPWVTESLVFTASTTTTSLSFTSLDANIRNGVLLDNVVVREVLNTGVEGGIIPITGFSLADIDAGMEDVRVELTAEGGSVFVNSTLGGVSPGDVTVTPAVTTFEGTLAEIAATFADAGGITFTADAGFSGLSQVTFTVSDLGNTGSGGAQSSTSTSYIYVEPVPSAPVIDASGASFLTPAVFDGSVANYAVSDAVTEFPTGDFAISLRVRDTGFEQAGAPGFPLEPYFSYHLDNTNDNEINILRRPDGTLTVANSSRTVSTSEPIPYDGQWHHLTVNFNVSSGTVDIYFDGELVEGALPLDGLIAPANGGIIAFGVEQDSPGGGFASEQTFNGSLDDVAIWNELLSPTDILNIARGEAFAANPPVLTAQWDGLSGTFVNSSGSTTFTTNGTVGAGPTFAPMTEDGSLVFRDFQVADGDGPDEVMTMVLTAPTGTFTVFSSDGIFGSAITNNNTGTVTVEGTRADINDWLQNHGFRYQPPADFFGDVDITIDVTDSFALTDSFPLTINVLSVNDAATVSATTDPTNLVEGDQGVVSIASIDLNSTFTASDPDGTPMIDPDSITIVDGLNTGFAGSSQLFYVEGDEVKLDTGLLDALQTGSSIDAVVFFDVVSGPETFSRSITITVDGVTDSTINFVEGSSARDTFTPTTGDDFFVSGGNISNDEEFLFGGNGNDILIGSDAAVGERFDGGDGNDTIITGSNNASTSDFSAGSRGSDRYYFTGNGNGYQGISYAALTGGLVATISAATNTATIDKGAGEIDTIIDVAAAVYSGDGGFGLYGSAQTDTFNIDNGPITDETQFMQVGGGRGNDVYNIISGNIRLDLRRDENFEQPETGVQINLSLGSNQIINDGFGGTDTITGPGSFTSIRTTDLDDSIIGSAADEQFIARQGNDVIDGGSGFDTIRYDRLGAASVELDLAANSSVGIWGDGQFNQTLTNIEGVRGSNIGVDTILGSTADNRLEGRGGTDIIDGRSGNDTLIGGSGGDVFIITSGSGVDVIEDFDPTTSGDRLVFDYSGINALGDFESVTLNGSDTLIDIDGAGNTLLLQNYDLNGAPFPADFLVFSAEFGGTGDETLTGTAVSDALLGNGGDDTLLGLDGDDILISGRGVQDFSTTGETLDGGAGNDLLIGGTFSAVRLIGGAGDDQLMAANVSFSDDATRWFEWVVFDYSNDPLGIIANLTSANYLGVVASSVLDGYGGTDSVTGVRTIYDTSSGDFFRIDGSLENSHSSNRVEVELSSGGDDTVDFTGASRGRVAFTNASEGVSVNLATGIASDINASNGNQIGSNSITGATEIKGSDFGDVLTGNGGDNQFQGRGGDDTITGGAGIDSISHWSARDFVTVDLSAATEQVSQDGFGGTDTVSGIENVNGGLSHDMITGQTNSQVLNGYAGNDVLRSGGLGGAVTLIGDEGSAAGVSGGNDTLIGADGLNVMIGGEGSDVFVFKLESTGDNRSNIEDFSLADGDLIDVSDFGVTSTADFNRFLYSAVEDLTIINVRSGGSGFEEFIVRGIDLTVLPNPDELFIFTRVDGIDGANDPITADGDDGTWYRAFESNPNFGFDQIFVEFGSYTFDYSFSRMGEQRLSYSAVTDWGITADLDGVNNTGTILKDGGVEGTDTIFNIQNVVNDKSDGFHIFGTTVNDSFTIDNGDNTYMEITALEGNNSFQIDSGVVRVNYSFNFVSPIVANLIAGTITHSAGNSDTVSGALGITEIVGTRDTDTFIGTANDETFIGLGGDDNINGGAGIDRVRYDLVGDTSELDVDLTAGTADGAFDEDGFSHTLTGIEWVTGSFNDDIIAGSSNNERLDGGGGADTISGQGGNDVITVADVAFTSVDGGTGQDILQLDAGGVFLDLATGGGTNTVTGIETFDLKAGNGETKLKISENDVIDLSTEGNASILAALGISNDTLLVEGDSSDVLQLYHDDFMGSGWSLDTIASSAMDGYDVFTASNGGGFTATVAVDEDVQVELLNIS
ncbi:choice-of-anchor C family protein [Ahrensia sp. R2A130]|uniref:choice-of-anchor C family protein n=1 Tax=Ahrensia sp. R2A130 TaxID=744979 RepID=UPI0001E11292|nr:choice-of-anchor C family protein [Ahrensia sp. R2A130]EFL90016.1 putative Ig domain protein [Ahrensia sp. R2A130]